MDLGARNRVGAAVVAEIVTRNGTRQRAVLWVSCARNEGAGVYKKSCAYSQKDSKCVDESHLSDRTRRLGLEVEIG